jgi:hypothetical protein
MAIDELILGGEKVQGIDGRWRSVAPWEERLDDVAAFLSTRCLEVLRQGRADDGDDDSDEPDDEGEG